MRKHRAFTLTELLVVIGTLAVLFSLLIPVAAKARSAARAASCLSNLRQMGAAWTMYVADNQGALPAYVWNTPQAPSEAWNGSWLGILQSYGVKGTGILCPSAYQPLLVGAPTDNKKPAQPRRGYGNATYAWTGQPDPQASSGTAITFNATVFREGSYGYNRYLTAHGGFGPDGKATSLVAIRNLSDVPLMMDCVFADVQPENGVPAAPPRMPPDLTGQKVLPGTPDLWKLLIARHGNAINVAMADGSVRLVPLSALYRLTWNEAWQKYDLPVP